MVESGANVKAVQIALGHQTATMTLDLYGHLMGDGLDAVGDRMDRLTGQRAGPQCGTRVALAGRFP